MASQERCRSYFLDAMAEYRLSKLIKRYSIGLDTLVEFLNSKGAGIDSPNVNMKVSDEFLPELDKRFSRDKAIKEAAEQEGFLDSEMYRRLGDTQSTPSSEIEHISQGHAQKPEKAKEQKEIAKSHGNSKPDHDDFSIFNDKALELLKKQK